MAGGASWRWLVHSVPRLDCLLQDLSYCCWSDCQVRPPITGYACLPVNTPAPTHAHAHTYTRTHTHIHTHTHTHTHTDEGGRKEKEKRERERERERERAREREREKQKKKHLNCARSSEPNFKIWMFNRKGEWIPPAKWICIVGSVRETLWNSFDCGE